MFASICRVFRGATAAALVAALPAAAIEIQLPPERAAFKPSVLPGYQLVQRNCMVCHTAQYISTQPPSLGRAYWEATVKKMKKPFGAQFGDADIAPMVDYLVKTYGAERPREQSPAAALTPQEVRAAARYAATR